MKLKYIFLILVDPRGFSLDRQVDITLDNWLGGTGIIKHLDVCYKPTNRDLATLMIILSDNIATNQLIDIISMEKVNIISKSLGLKNTLLQRKIMDTEAVCAGRDNYTSAGDIGLLLKILAHKTGELPRLTHDVGVFFLPNNKRYILAILSNKLSSNNEGIKAIAEISLSVYNSLAV